MPFLKYFRTAFLNRWNLLAFLGGSAFALMSGHADVVLPLVAAGELAYLGLLGTHPKFQAYVNAQEAKAAREAGSVSSQRMLAHIIRALPKELLRRFESLRAQCLELRHIALELKQPGNAAAEPALEQLQMAGLDRLLWIHLRLLYTQYSLARFLQRTGEEQIEADIGQLEGRLAKLPAGPEQTPQQQRIRKALEDNLRTSRDRLANVQKGRENYQLVQLEIERLENKIRSLSEMAVNRQEPEFITNEVDHVASSLLDTERTMNELQFATGLHAADNEPPALLRVKATTTQK